MCLLSHVGAAPEEVRPAGRGQWRSCRSGPSEAFSGALQRGAGVKTAYRGYWIDYERKPVPSAVFDWDFWHDGYDGAPTDGSPWLAGNMDRSAACRATTALKLSASASASSSPAKLSA